MNRSFLAIVLLSFSVGAPPAFARTWTDSSGKYEIEAEFVSFEDGIVTLKKTDGKITELPLDKLSEADREHVKSLGQ